MVLKRAIFRTRDSLSQVELKRAVHPVVHPKNGKINRIRSGLESHPAPPNQKRTDKLFMELISALFL